MGGTANLFGQTSSFWKNLTQKLSGFLGRGSIAILSPTAEASASSPVAVKIAWDRSIKPGTFTVSLDDEEIPSDRFTQENKSGATAFLEVPSGTHKLAVSGLLSRPFLPGHSEETASCTFEVLPGDFSLAVQPPALVVEQGHSVPLQVTLERKGGFAGEVEIGIANPPPELSCPSVTVGPGETQAVLTLTTDIEAPLGRETLTVTGAGLTNDGEKAHSQYCDLTILEVSDFSLRVIPEALEMEQGESGAVQVLVSRTGSFRGDVKVGVLGLPAGVAPNDPVIPFFQNYGALRLTASDTAAIGSHPLTLRGASYVNNRLIERQGSLSLALLEKTDFALSLEKQELEAPLTGAAEVKVTVGWKGTFQDQVTVAASPLPRGVTANTPISLTQPPRSEHLLTLSAGSLARPGAYRLGVTGSAMIRGKAVSHRQDLELAVTYAPGPFQEAFPGWRLGTRSSPNGQFLVEIGRNPFGQAYSYYARLFLKPGVAPAFPTGANLATVDFQVGPTEEGGFAFSPASTSAVVMSCVDRSTEEYEYILVNFSQPYPPVRFPAAAHGRQVFALPRIWFSPDGTLAVICKANTGEAEQYSYQLELVEMGGASLGVVDCYTNRFEAAVVREEGEFKIKVVSDVGTGEQKESFWVIQTV